ncbi:MAG TPA: PQQ-binding-like beta-propeller repeat protein [Myxococcota bacterium]|nr:PQQ-binding-like beta-propeller repeat protein [Myxococcota bacterium]
MAKSCALLVTLTLAACARQRAATPVAPTVTRVAQPAAVAWSRAMDLDDVDILRLMPEERVLVGAMRRGAGANEPRELWMLDRRSGEVIWRGKRPSTGAHSVVGEAAGKVIVRMTEEARTTFLGIALDSGVILWEHQLAGAASATVDATQTRLIVATEQRVRALDADSGKQLWETSVAVRANDAGPIFAGDAAVVCIAAADIACLNTTTGALLWRKPSGDDKRVVAARLLGHTLLVGSDAGITTWNTTNGGARWWRSVPGKHLVSVELAGDGAATYRRDSLELTRSTTFAGTRDWGDSRAMTADGKAMIGWQAGTGVQSYEVERSDWRTAAATPEPTLIIEVRENRIASLRERQELPVCYGRDPGIKLPYDAIEHAAVLGNNRTILRELEAEGARDVVSIAGVEYGDIATALGFTDVADELLGRGQRIAIGAELALAVARDDVAGAKAVLERGARPNGASAFNTKRSCYPVPLAASGSVAMSEVLLAKGAVLNLIDGKGQTPLDARIAAKDEPNIAFLRSRGGRTADELRAKP